MSSINELLLKIKPFYTLILALIVASIFFALGRLSALEDKHTPIKIGYPNSLPNKTETAGVINSVTVGNTSAALQRETSSGAVIGSKSGKKYYFPWCGTVSRIKPENQVHFASIADAKSAGFTPGGNCKGLN